MQQNRAGVNLGCKKSLFCQLWEDVSDLYTSAADTYLPACNLVCCSCRCRTCSTTISRLISAAVTVSYLRQNSRLLDDNGGPVVGSQFCSVAKMCGSNRIRQSGLPLTGYQGLPITFQPYNLGGPRCPMFWQGGFKGSVSTAPQDQRYSLEPPDRKSVV